MAWWVNLLENQSNYRTSVYLFHRPIGQPDRVFVVLVLYFPSNTSFSIRQSMIWFWSLVNFALPCFDKHGWKLRICLQSGALMSVLNQSEASFIPKSPNLPGKLRSFFLSHARISEILMNIKVKNVASLQKNVKKYISWSFTLLKIDQVLGEFILINFFRGLFYGMVVNRMKFLWSEMDTTLVFADRFGHIPWSTLKQLDDHSKVIMTLLNWLFWKLEQKSF